MVNGKEVQSELVSIAENGTNQAFQSGVSLLHDLFNSSLKSYKGLSEKYIIILLKSMEQRHNSKKYLLNYSHMLLKSTLKLDTTLLPPNRWNLLVFLCIHNGLFMVANIAREKAVKSVYQALDNTKSMENLIQAFKAYMDQGELNKASQALLSVKKSSVEESSLNRMEIFFSVLTGDRERTSKLCKRHFSEQDWTFFHYINGKTVAIVGPAPKEEDVSAEINSFDIVVRFNYKGEPHLPHKGSGNRINVSYHNGGNAAELDMLDHTDFLNELDFACFKSVKYDFQRKLVSAHKGRQYRIAGEFLFNGAANHLPNVLFDILHFHPKMVKVFHSNLYLSSTPHYTGYHTIPKENQSLWNTFAYHEMITQFNFLKNLWNGKQFKADKALESVLKLTPEKYVELMERIHVYPYLNK
ncbi:hypothetical protein [Gracilibacillus xinjiangensis]|uniref:Uncharacterized protein n=1 Tax=Gracilibacillus xinjiangensis TaxID=1193282 RepID=A0ABV8WWZ5_9BACI